MQTKIFPYIFGGGGDVVALRCYSNNRPIFTIDLFGLGHIALWHEARRKSRSENARHDATGGVEKEHMLSVGIIRSVYMCYIGVSAPNAC